MTVEEKRNELRNYCNGRSCWDCPLDHFHDIDNGCYSSYVDDIKVERNYKIVLDSISKATSEDPVNLGDDLSISQDGESFKSVHEILFGNKSEATSEDPVNRPAHYTDGKIEVIDYIEDKKLGFCLGNAIKYISRAGKKDPSKEVEDLNKAKWYIERRIKELTS